MMEGQSINLRSTTIFESTLQNKFETLKLNEN